METHKEGDAGKGPEEVLLEDSETEAEGPVTMDAGGVSSVEAIARGIRTSEGRSIGGEDEVFYTPTSQRK